MQALFIASLVFGAAPAVVSSAPLQEASAAVPPTAPAPAAVTARLPTAPAAAAGAAPPRTVHAPAAAVPPLPAGAPAAGQPLPPAPPPPRYCPGAYADEFTALSQKAREFEQAHPPFTYCLRTTAVYECPSYAPDGSLRRARRKVTAHGTGFGYRQEPGDTLIVTNQHVAEWPAVTDEDHPVGDVPPGCKRVSDSIRIVENEKDDYERDDTPLSRVVSDPQLDIAVLRAKALLPTLPWKLGHSAALKERNAVDVRGFPLGVLRANNVGKVISAYDHDDDREWDHDDFVVDALLSPGNSGSPVFAISCETGEFELVGVYHAGYSKGSALNVVVGIDQLRDLLTTLKRSPRARKDASSPLNGDDRARLLDLARADVEPMFFPFGGLVATARTRSDGALVFELMAKDFPMQAYPTLVLEDLPPGAGDGFGRLGRFWAGNRQGLRQMDRPDTDAETLATVSRLLDAVRRSALLAGSYHAAMKSGMSSRERYMSASRLGRTVRRTSDGNQELAQVAADLVDHLCPATADATSTLAEALTVPARPADLLEPSPLLSRARSLPLRLGGNWRPLIEIEGSAPLAPPAPIMSAQR
jgi:S1-C subfamily serine protease